MSLKTLKWVYRLGKWSGIGFSIVSGSGVLAAPFIAKEIAEEFMQEILEGSATEVLGKAVEVVSENGDKLFKIQGVEELLPKEKALEELTRISSSFVNYHGGLGVAAGQIIAQGADQSLGKLEKQEIIQTQNRLINDEAKNNFEKAQEIVDEYGLSRKTRDECDSLLEKIEKMEGVYKIAGVKWLLSEDAERLNNELSELGNDFHQDVKMTILNFGIDITQPSPIFRPRTSVSV